MSIEGIAAQCGFKNKSSFYAAFRSVHQMTPTDWLLLLFLNLSMYTLSMFFGWAIIGLIVYALYGYRRSHLAPGNSQAPGGPALEPHPTFPEGPDPGP